MPLKSGRLTPMERSFVKHYVDTSDAQYAAVKAGYKTPKNDGRRALNNEIVAAEVRKLQVARLNDELLPAAVDVLAKILTDDKASERGKIMAAKIVLDRTLGDPAAGQARKELHEMSGTELDQALAKLQGELRQRSTKALDVTPNPDGVFE